MKCFADFSIIESIFRFEAISCIEKLSNIDVIDPMGPRKSWAIMENIFSFVEFAKSKSTYKSVRSCLVSISVVISLARPTIY